MIRSITQDQVNDVTDLLNLDGDAARTSYPGRGMYGKTCIGFVVDHADIVAVGVALADVLVRNAVLADDPDDSSLDEALDDVLELAKGGRIDSMGTQAIVYFPRLSLTP